VKKISNQLRLAYIPKKLKFVKLSPNFLSGKDQLVSRCQGVKLNLTSNPNRPIKFRVMLNGVPGAIVKDTKIEIKAKVFNRKDSFLTLQCIECTISKNILPFLYP
jgi:hypothetical protein